jgi:hypothetical protein
MVEKDFGRDSYPSFEVAIEMTLMGKPDLKCNVCDRQLTLNQQLFCPLNATLNHILMGYDSD